MKGECLVLVLAGIRLLESRGEGGEAVFRKLRRHAGLEPAHQHQDMAGPIFESARAPLLDLHHRRFVEAEGKPQLRRDERGGAGEAGGRDSHDRDLAPISVHGFSEEMGIAAPALPEAVAHDRHRHVASRLFFVGEEGAALHDPHPQGVEVVGRDQPRHRPARRPAVADPHHGQVVGEQGSEHFVAVADIAVVGVGESPPGVGLRPVAAEEAVEHAVVAAGQGPEQEGVDEAEHGGVGADAQGQDEHGHRGEARCFAEQA